MSRMDPRETCANCRWWQQEGREGATSGECRERSPGAEGWPYAPASGWCGSFAFMAFTEIDKSK